MIAVEVRPEEFRAGFVAYHLKPAAEAKELSTLLARLAPDLRRGVDPESCGRLLSALRHCGSIANYQTCASEGRVDRKSEVAKEEVFGVLKYIYGCAGMTTNFGFGWPESEGLYFGSKHYIPWPGQSSYPHISLGSKTVQSNSYDAVKIGPSEKENGAFMVVVTLPK